jgi:taurine dioxygenase
MSQPSASTFEYDRGAYQSLMKNPSFAAFLSVPMDLQDPPTTSYERFTVEPRGRTVGALVRGVDLKVALDDDLLEQLWRAFLDWKVLFFRDQFLNREQLFELTARWADKMSGAPKKDLKGGTGTDLKIVGHNLEISGINVWHADAWPIVASILHCRRVPAVGGDTVFSDMCAVYDNLPAEVRDRIKDLTVTPGKLPYETGKGAPMTSGPQRVVKTHPDTGRRLVYCNTDVLRPSQTPQPHILSGLDAEKNLDLQRQFAVMVRQPEVQARLRWEVGSLALFDNRSLMHYGSADFRPGERLLEQTNVVDPQSPWWAPAES